MEYKHLVYCPWTGLGLYNGFRGNNWLKNRIKIFKQFVIPSLQSQTTHDFTLWCSWRPEENNNKHVLELISYLDSIEEFKTIHTFNGVCFYDDKYEDTIAKDRLFNSLHYSMGKLLDEIGQVDYILMTIQPSDDIYATWSFKVLQDTFKSYDDIEGLGFKKGYICNYQTLEVKDYNPQTNPPFYTIKFKKEDFIEPLNHIQFTSLKSDVGKYKKGTPLPSHEYVKDCINYRQIDERGFLVGTHQDNISTGFDNPYAGKEAKEDILEQFGIEYCGKLKIKFSLGRYIFSKLPYQAKRKLRYWSGEKKWILRPLFNVIYNLLRS